MPQYFLHAVIIESMIELLIKWFRLSEVVSKTLLKPVWLLGNKTSFLSKESFEFITLSSKICCIKNQK